MQGRIWAMQPDPLLGFSVLLSSLKFSSLSGFMVGVRCKYFRAGQGLCILSLLIVSVLRLITRQWLARA